MNDFKKKVVYQIYPKSFKDTNGTGTGDLKGVIEKLDYLQTLGVDYIWLTPFYVSPQNDNGYDVADYYNIDPSYGTMEDVENLIAEAKKRNIYLMMDMVFNHVSTEHIWFKKAMAGEEKYLKADTLSNTPSSNELWGSKQEAGTFLITRKKDYYTICDETTKRNLSQNDGSILGFTTDSNAVWRLTRNKKAIEKENLQVFVQFDPVWAKHHYGNETTKDTDTNNFCTSGCGIFAIVNAIYSLSGHFPDPYELAQYASDKHYRIEDCGTDSSFFKAAAEKFGYKYGFSYDGSGESFKELKEKLKEGDTAIIYLPGHYGTIVDYNAKKDKYLLMDPHYLPKRGTSSFGDWVSQKDLEEGALMVQTFFYYKAE